MDSVDLQLRHIAFIHDEMWQIENNDQRHSSEQKQAEVIRKETEKLLE